MNGVFSISPLLFNFYLGWLYIDADINSEHTRRANITVGLN